MAALARETFTMTQQQMQREAFSGTAVRLQDATPPGDSAGIDRRYGCSYVRRDRGNSDFSRRR